jgi:hypothetical protein
MNEKITIQDWERVSDEYRERQKAAEKKILIQRGQDVFREKFKNLSLALEENMNIPDSTLNFRDEVEWIDTQIFLQKEKMEKTDVDSVIFSARETIEALNVFGKLNNYDDGVNNQKIKIILHSMYFNCDIGTNPTTND